MNRKERESFRLDLAAGIFVRMSTDPEIRDKYFWNDDRSGTGSTRMARDSLAAAGDFLAEAGYPPLDD